MKININTFLFQYLQLHVLLVNDTRNGQVHVHVMLHAVWTSKIAFHINGDVLQVIIKLILCINIYIVINYIVNEIYMYIKESLTNLNLSFDMFQRSMLHFNFIEISISFLLKQSINGMQHHTFISNSILFCQKSLFLNGVLLLQLWI